MTKPKQEKGKKDWILAIFLIAILIAIGLSFLFTNRYISTRLEAEMEKVLPEFERRAGLTVLVGDIKVNLFSGTEISKISIRTTTSDDSAPWLRISKLTVSHSIRWKPKLGVRIDSVMLTQPAATMHLKSDGSTNLPDSLVILLRSSQLSASDKGFATDKSSSLRKIRQRLEIPSTLEVHWKKGRLVLYEGRFGKSVNPSRFELVDSKGSIRLDRIDRSLTVDSHQRLGNSDSRFSLHVESDGNWVEATLSGKRVALQEFAPYFPSWLRGDTHPLFNGSLSLRARKNSPIRTIRFDGDFENFSVDHWRISNQPIRNIAVKANGLVEWNTVAELFRIHLLRIGMKDAVVQAEGTVDYAGPLRVDTRFHSREMSIQDALDALPADLIPTLQGARVAGRLNLDLRLAFDMDRPQDLLFEPKVEVSDFSLLKAPAKADIHKLKGTFTHVVKRHGEVVKEIVVGPINRDFVPYDQLGYYTIRGVLTCEDGRFFTHSGFQLKHVQASIIRNLREKRFARGASTITMQTAKNLFLSHRKTLSRKFQEILLAYCLEQELDKKRILEIYMNIIEWGPDLYGIGPAARHYFYKSPAGLLPIEAAFLGSIIANPVRYHFMYARGQVTESWSTYLCLIVGKMGIDHQLYEEAEPFEPEFGWVRKKRLAEEKKAKEAMEKVNSRGIHKTVHVPSGK